MADIIFAPQESCLLIHSLGGSQCVRSESLCSRRHEAVQKYLHWRLWFSHSIGWPTSRSSHIWHPTVIPTSFLIRQEHKCDFFFFFLETVEQPVTYSHWRTKHIQKINKNQWQLNVDTVETNAFPCDDQAVSCSTTWQSAVRVSQSQNSYLICWTSPVSERRHTGEETVFLRRLRCFSVHFTSRWIKKKPKN